MVFDITAFAEIIIGVAVAICAGMYLVNAQMEGHIDILGARFQKDTNSDSSQRVLYDATKAGGKPQDVKIRGHIRPLSRIYVSKMNTAEPIYYFEYKDFNGKISTEDATIDQFSMVKSELTLSGGPTLYEILGEGEISGADQRTRMLQQENIQMHDVIENYEYRLGISSKDSVLRKITEIQENRATSHAGSMGGEGRENIIATEDAGEMNEQ
jgi:hypothetical protein